MIASREQHPDAATGRAGVTRRSCGFHDPPPQGRGLRHLEGAFRRRSGRSQAGGKGPFDAPERRHPNEVFTRVEFDSVEDATAFRDRLVASGALSRATVLTPPTVVELVENPMY